jgi:hypothetical protein
MWLLRLMKWPGKWVMRNLVMLGAILGIAILAFCWGRNGARSQTPAPTPASAADPRLPPLPSPASYTGRVVAYIYNSVPVTREELGEYLIARLGMERVEFLVNRKIIEHVAKSKGIEIPPQELQLAYKADLDSLHLSHKDFVEKLLKREHKTFYEYMYDVLWPRLVMRRMCQDRVKVTEQEVMDAFEAQFGEKVECRAIVLPDAANGHINMQIWEKVRKSEQEFDSYARNQNLPGLAAKGGKVDPIYRHFPDANVEREAFSLKPGEVSALIGLPDKTALILKCVKRIERDTNATMQQEHDRLIKQIFEQKLAMEIPKEFKGMREQASPTVFLKKELTQEELERAVNREIHPPVVGPSKTGPAPPAPPAPPGK